ncbi:MAG: uL15 family ribosomal protein [Patescibacteria group bacterium]
MEKNSLTRPSHLKGHRRIGRGGKRGKTSGRGTKGQLARTGNSTRPELLDIIKKYPKRRGYGKNRALTVIPNRSIQTVNLDQISKHFEVGAEVTARALLKKGLVRRESGRTPKVKVLARGVMDKKVTFKGLVVSTGARTLIEKAGGTLAD